MRLGSKEAALKPNCSGYHEVLGSYRDIRPSTLKCSRCGQMVLRGSGKINKMDVLLPTAIYACQCIYRSSSQLSAPPLQSDWDREVSNAPTLKPKPKSKTPPAAVEELGSGPRRVGTLLGIPITIMQTYTIHPVALKFPEIPPEEYAELKESIRKYGQFEPIIVSEGKVLDGRHRYQICLELGMEPNTINFADHQAKAKDNLTVEEFIFDSNVKRRHLNESQRAAIAAEFANMRQGERTDAEPCDNCHKVSQQKAGELLKVSRKSVSRAKKVKDKDPETFAKVKAGDVSLNAAVNLIEKSAAESLRAEPKQDKTALSLEDYDDAWQDASLKEDCPSMDNFFSTYNNDALGELGENLVGAILDKQDQLAALADYLEKQDYDMPAVERFIPARWS